jgi:hypothetical protein
MTTKRPKKKAKEKEFNIQHWLSQKLRRISYQYPPRKEAIKRDRVARGKYRCNSCGGENFGPKDIQLDHTEAVIDPVKGFQDWNTYIARLFCDVDGWKILCKQCHEAKTFLENNVRRQIKIENRKKTK